MQHQPNLFSLRVELKYSRTVLFKISNNCVSIPPPEGLAIKPLIPANCFIWAVNPEHRVCHHINWISFYSVILINFFSWGYFLHHFICNSVSTFRPNITTLLYFSPLVINHLNIVFHILLFAFSVNN